MIDIMSRMANDAVANSAIQKMQEEGAEASMTMEGFESYLYANGEVKVAERLAVLRKDKRLSIRKLSGRTGIPYNFISEMENNKRPIGKREAQKLSKELDVDYRFLM
jgi:hypothetical protein